MSDDREFSNIYTIPPNYTDSGKLMGGMLETRNTVEAGILLVLVGGVFVMEAVSVMLQVASFKTTGKRIFLCARIIR